jgi:D-alanyl-D-alanine carboxypeptidase/D-alanyl-D-alanine-endopeptidase (penicillin-binding protein 4)
MSYEFRITAKKRLFKFIKQFIILNSSFIILFSSCSVEKQIGKSAKADVLDAKALQTAHVGISIFDPAANKYLYNYQGDKYFVPASNIKIPTCYAAMKYLGDSLVGLRYLVDYRNNHKIIQFEPTGDPTFLHPDFLNQNVADFFKNDTSAFFLLGEKGFWKDKSWGSGWAWNDYQESYMAERSGFPIYGNIVRISSDSGILSIKPSTIEMRFGGRSVTAVPPFEIFRNHSFQRSQNENVLLWDFPEIANKNSIKYYKEIPLITSFSSSIKFLKDTIPGLKMMEAAGPVYSKVIFPYTIHSQPTDSLLKPMMHRSDNFFAEQSLLMVSNEMLGVMNDAKIIDTILKTDFKDLPQKPRWADGSGLSRYNLFTPQDFVAILNKMKNEFGMQRLKVILPTGGEGTISSYYKADSGYIYAKTGTLSGVVAFSGFLYTKKGKLLIFSTLVNNHQASATEVRRAIEKFLTGVRSKF